MTDAMMSLCGVMEKSADASLPGEMIGLPRRFLIRLAVAGQRVTLLSSLEASQVPFAEPAGTSAKPAQASQDGRRSAAIGGTFLWQSTDVRWNTTSSPNRAQETFVQPAVLNCRGDR